jgi:hypothetical protein
MNALVGRKAKANFSADGVCVGLLRTVRRQQGPHDGARQDGGDFASAGPCRHLGRGLKFEGLQDSSVELQ